VPRAPVGDFIKHCNSVYVPTVFKSWQLKMVKHCRNTAGIVIAVCHISYCSVLNLL
jgi:hypothetical protein